MADLTVGIPAYNDSPLVFREVLGRAIAGSDDVPIVVVDMSERPALREVCAVWADRVRYEWFPESGGVSHSRNRCVELAPSRFVAFLDSDALPEPGWLDPLVEPLRAGRAAVTGSRILPEWEKAPSRLMRTRPAADWFSLFDLGEREQPIPRVMGTSYALDRERAPDPPFDESVGRSPGWAIAMEENLLCEAVRAAGHEVVYVPESVVRHSVPRDRMKWRWIWRRAFTAGREARLAGRRQEPLPGRRFDPWDRAFQAAVLPFFLAGIIAPRAKKPSDRVNGPVGR